MDHTMKELKEFMLADQEWEIPEDLKERLVKNATLTLLRF